MQTLKLNQAIKDLAKQKGLDLSPQGLAAFREQVNKKYAATIEQYRYNANRNFYYERSIVLDKNIFNNKFRDIKPTNSSLVDNAKKIKTLGEKLKQGEKFFMILQGKPGTGKTMLASALLNDISNNTDPPMPCLFIDATRFRDLALAMNDHSVVTERERNRYLQLKEDIKKAEIVVLDDLGSETSMNSVDINTANETVQRALFELTSTLQNRVLIITTNYEAKQLHHMYNEKLLSRILTPNAEHIIKFNDIPDYRSTIH